MGEAGAVVRTCDLARGRNTSSDIQRASAAARLETIGSAHRMANRTSVNAFRMAFDV
jgi:hypothetical protein